MAFVLLLVIKATQPDHVRSRKDICVLPALVNPVVVQTYQTDRVSQDIHVIWVYAHQIVVKHTHKDFVHLDKLVITALVFRSLLAFCKMMTIRN
jgi:hypothetical protein